MSKDNTFRPINRLWALLKPDYAEIRSIYLYAFIAGFISLSLPLGIQAIVNFIQMGAISTSWLILVIVIVFGVLFNGLLQIFQLRITENLQQKIFVRNAFNFANKIPKVKVSSLKQKYVPELMNRFLETTSLQKGIAKILIDFIAATLQILFGMILLSFYHPFFVLLSILLLALFFLVFRFLFKRGIQTSLNESKFKFQLQSWLEEMARNIFLFKNHGSEEWHLEKTNQITEKYLDSRENHFKVLKANYYYLILFKIIMITGLLLLGGYLVIEQKMNIGQFVASEIIIILLMSSIEKLTSTIEVFFDILTALEKLGEVTDLPIENQNGLVLDNQHAISKISFESLIDAVKITEKNDIQYIHGHTIEPELFQAVIGWNDYQGIKVLVNDFPLKNYNIQSYRRQTDYINEASEIFEGTVFENLLLGNPTSDLNKIGNIIQNCFLKNDIEKFNKGFHEKLNPSNFPVQNAFTLKVAIARIFINEPKVVFIHNSFEKLEDEEALQIAKELKNGPWQLVIIGTNKYFN